MKYCKLKVLLVFLILIMSIGMVSATESVSTDANVNNGNGIISFSKLVVDDNHLTVSGTVGSFSDLYDDIDKNTVDGVLNLNRSYKYDDDTDKSLVNGINLNGITINGNNNTIDGDHQARIFNQVSGTVILNNVKFVNGKSPDDSNGGAISVASGDLIINNCQFENNYADKSGGAVGTVGTYSSSTIKVVDSDFRNNSAKIHGGAINARNLVVENSLFESNKVLAISGANLPSGIEEKALGGAIFSYNSNITDSRFNKNYVVNRGLTQIDEGGGAIANINKLNIDNCNFTGNNASKGGAIFSLAAYSSDLVPTNYVNVNNSRFISNVALDGGAICSNYNITVNNSLFDKNAATGYGGGAINTGYKNNNNAFINSNFTNNTAANYGGALGISHADIVNCVLADNKAKHGGAIFSSSFTIANSTLYGNIATVGNKIVVIGGFKKDDNTVIPEEDYVIYNQSQISNFANDVMGGNSVFDDHYIDSGTWAGYEIYCIEQHLFIPDNAEGVVINDLSYITNSINNELVSEYIKIMFYLKEAYPNNYSRYSIQDITWIFTDGNYLTSTNRFVKDIIEWYDNNFRLNQTTYILPNGSKMEYDMVVFLTPTDGQNMVLFKSKETAFVYNETLKKETLSENVSLGGEAYFRVIVNNTGDDDLIDVFINDTQYDSGLIYKTWISEKGNWSAVSDGVWVLNDLLKPGETASIIVVFSANATGELVNNATSGYLNITLCNATNKTYCSIAPNMTVRKITGEETVTLGDDVYFIIVVENTGDCNLTGVYVTDDDYTEGLIYDYFVDSTNMWKFDGDCKWTYDGVLQPGEQAQFMLFFLTNSTGLKFNTAVAGNNLTNDTVNSTNTTNVTTHEINETLKKDSLNESVLVGGDAYFRIVVENTGDENLIDVFINDTQYDSGLIYKTWISEKGNWHAVSDGVWVLDDLFAPGDSASIIVVFTVNATGELVNNATSGYLDITLCNATNKTHGHIANMTITKISNNDIVYLGEETSFTIIVENTGDCNLTGVYVSDNDYSEGLIYDYYVDTTNMWKYEGDYKWIYDGVLEAGQNAQFTLFFITNSTGLKVNTAITGNNITNETKNSTNNTTVKGITINVTKVWNDSDDHDGFRPENVTFVLYADGDEYANVTLNGTGNVWSGSFTDLPVYKDNKPIVYSVVELAVDNYTFTITNRSLANFTITNTRIVNYTSVNVTKVWNDSDDHDGFRPTNVTFVLLADGKENATITLNGTGNVWSGSFTGLPVYKDGKAIEYSVVELAVDNYTSAVTNRSLANFTITNTRIVNYTSVNVTKIWHDDNNHDGFRPANVTFILNADGQPYANVTLNGTGNVWSGSFTDLPVYKDGKAIVYSVVEFNVSGYNSTVTNRSLANFTITNSRVTEYTSVNVTKVWDDDNNHDGFRPYFINFVLLADGDFIDHVVLNGTDNVWSFSFNRLPVYREGKAIVYSVIEFNVSGYNSTVTNSSLGNFTITNSRVTEYTSVNVTKVWDDDNNHDGFRPANVTFVLFADGKENATITLNGTGNVWSGSFTDLPVYKDGKAIEYSVVELAVDNYTSTVTNRSLGNYTIVNSRIVEFTSVNVTKIWNDSDDHDGFRPANVTFVLFADGKENATITLNGTGNVWSGSFTGLPVYKDAKAIEYSVVELAVDNYTSTVTNRSLGNYTIVNSRVVEFTSVNVTKVWNDSDNHDGFRPANVTFVLKANGDYYANVTLTGEGNTWSGSFADLPVYANGSAIGYSVEELSVDKYNSTVTNDSLANYTIINSRVVEFTNMNVTKVWNDSGNQDGIRPENITVYLLADGNPVNETVLSEANNWTVVFGDLPVYNNGKPIVYSFKEAAVADYTVVITKDGNNFTITNTHVVKSTEVHVTKVWDDSGNKDGIRPENVTVYLLADGVRVNMTVLSEANGWAAVFGDLPVYVDGKRVVYSIEEDAVANYTTVISNDGNNFTIVNTHVAENQTDNHTNKTTFVNKVKFDRNATGNPLFALILVLISLGVVTFKRKN